MKKIFVDTGFWIALFDDRDSLSSEAVMLFNRSFSNHSIVTSDLVIGETLTYLNCSLKRHDIATLFLKKLRSLPLTSMPVDVATKNEAYETLVKHADLAQLFILLA